MGKLSYMQQNILNKELRIPFQSCLFLTFLFAIRTLRLASTFNRFHGNICVVAVHFGEFSSEDIRRGEEVWRKTTEAGGDAGRAARPQLAGQSRGRAVHRARPLAVTHCSASLDETRLAADRREEPR